MKDFSRLICAVNVFERDGILFILNLVIRFICVCMRVLIFNNILIISVNEIKFVCNFKNFFRNFRLIIPRG